MRRPGHVAVLAAGLALTLAVGCGSDNPDPQVSGPRLPANTNAVVTTAPAATTAAPTAQTTPVTPAPGAGGVTAPATPPAGGSSGGSPANPPGTASGSGGGDAGVEAYCRTHPDACD